MAQKPPDCAPAPWPHPRAVGSLKRSGPTAFEFVATAPEREAIARFLELTELSQLRWRGTIVPEGDDGWRLDARLTADLAQPCIVSLEPVPARIDQQVTRHFVREEHAGAIDLDPEAEDDPDTYGNTIDPGAVAIEVLALALDPYPRAAEIEPVELRATPPGAEVLDDAAMKPFASLAALKARLAGGEND